MTAPREWNAGAYDRLSSPQFAWGHRVMERVAWRGDEDVLDAGCGSGRLTRALAAKVTAGRVTALDRSFNMTAQTRANVSRVVQADLLALPFRDAFDVIFSTATFHWVLDHQALFSELHGALKPGGWLTAQCGGGPNLDRLHARALRVAATPPYASFFEGWTNPWEFASAETTAERLSRAGFRDVDTWLEETPTTMPDAATYMAFVETVVLRAHLARLPDEPTRQRYLTHLTELAAEDDPPFLLDYWRLNIHARRADRGAR